MKHLLMVAQKTRLPWRSVLLVILLIGAAASGCTPSPTPPASPTATQTVLMIPYVMESPISPLPPPQPVQRTRPAWTVRVINTYPHDSMAFTQGLVFQDGILYEGTGLNGRSSLRQVELETGKVIQQINLAEQFFGEGIVVWEQTVVQLTWQSNTGLVYDKKNFKLLRQFSYPTEGWGITHDGRRLIMSDGTATLHFWQPDTLQEIGQVNVYDSDGPVMRLNELEYVQGEVWANVWQTDMIARIDPQSGQVTGWIDLGELRRFIEQPTDVLNGIAYDAAQSRLFVTGKLWPFVFEVQIVPTQN